MALAEFTLGIILATLAAIVYSLRVLVLMERRMARIDVHIEALVTRVFEQELEIESEEKDIEVEEGRIERMLLGRAPRPPRKASRKPAKKKSAKKRKR